MFRPLRFFSIASLISVVLATVVLGVVYRHIATGQLLALGENNNVALAQIFANAVWPQYRFYENEGRTLDVLSSHVALRAGTDAPIEGVLEIYTDVTDLVTSIDRQDRLVTLIVMAVLAVLCGILLLVARHADNVIRRQLQTPT